MKEQEEFLLKIILALAIIWLATTVIFGETIVNRNEEIHNLKIENNKLTNIIKSNLVEKVSDR